VKTNKPETAAKPLAIIYSRVSTIRQSETGHSLDSQESNLVMNAEREGYEVEVLREVASGGRDTRPQLNKALAMLNTGKASALYVASIDRLARSTKHALAISEQSVKNSWRLVVENIGADTATTQGKFMFQLMAVIAELENNLISDRVKKQHLSRQQRGIVWGVHQGFNGNLDPVARGFIIAMAGQGLSLRQISKGLEEAGYKTATGKTTWQPRTIKQILESPQTQVMLQAA
jgi:DNA invertase Pin-like site-specific DNA recombinase